jgi:TonB family protein
MLQENSVCKEDSKPDTNQFELPQTQTTVAGDLGTFSRAIVVEAPGYTGRRAIHSMFSFVAHLAVVMAIVWFGPLAFPQRPYLFAMNRQFVTFPLSGASAAGRAALPFAPAVSGNPFRLMSLVAPVRRFSVSHSVISPPAEVLQPRLKSTEELGAVLGGIVNASIRPAIVPALPLDIPPDAQFIRTGGDIQSSRLVERVSFSYPEIAKFAHVSGSVVIAAVIDETGKVTDARLVSGPGLLASAAIDDLSRERFEPLLLDGQPTKCELMVRVTFRLAGW